MQIRVILTSAAGTMALTTENSPEMRDTLSVISRKLTEDNDGTCHVFLILRDTGVKPARGPDEFEARVEDDRGELPYLEARRALREWVGLPEMVS